jgi:RND family efflux transporter MFP subunit
MRLALMEGDRGMWRLLGLSLLMAAPLHGVVLAQGGRDVATVEALTQPRHDLELSFTIPGRVAAVLVEEGAVVTAGDPLVRLDDREVQARIKLLRVRAEADLQEKAAEAAWRLAQNEHEVAREAFADGAMGEFEVARAKLEEDQARISFELAQQRRLEAELQLDEALLSLEQFTIRAPKSGIIERVVADAGETVRELTPVVRLVSIDPLRIDAATPLETALQIRPGHSALVRYRAAGLSEDLEARVVHVASVADAASGTRLVRLELANPQGLPAGARVSVRFVQETAAATP